VSGRPWLVQRRWPLEPLLDVVRASPPHVAGQTFGSWHDPLLWLEPVEWTWEELAGVLGVNIRSLFRWAKDGVPERSADEMACRMGLHPLLVWPDWFDVELEVA